MHAPLSTLKNSVVVVVVASRSRNSHVFFVGDHSTTKAINNVANEHETQDARATHSYSETEGVHRDEKRDVCTLCALITHSKTNAH